MLEERGRGHRPELDISPIPEPALYLFNWFVDLSSERQGGFGPQPITSSAIRDWAWRKQIRLTRWEGEALRALDTAYLRVWNELHHNEEK